MDNINLDDLRQTSQAFTKTKRPKVQGLSSLEEAQRQVNFGTPKTDIKEGPPSAKATGDKDKKIKITLSSPTIKKRPVPPAETEKKLVQETDIEKLISQGEFSAKSISFIPFGAGFINAEEALEKISSDRRNFFCYQINYLTEENINFILAKIEKIYDLVDPQKQTLKDFYLLILKRKLEADEKRKKAQELLTKIKAKNFRTNLSTEIQRMIKGEGDLYNYYLQFDLIDQEFKKRFLKRITEIDTYIIKKIKELVGFAQNDLQFRYEEILEFISVLDTRNILMDNFHSQVEHLASQKKSADSLRDTAKKIEQETLEIAKTYGRSGKYGRAIDRSYNIVKRLKINYFETISAIIEPAVTKIQKIILSLDTGNYLSLESIKEQINTIDSKSVDKRCYETFEKTQKQGIK